MKNYYAKDIIYTAVVQIGITAAAFSILLLVGGCTMSQIDRLEYVGKEPPMEMVKSPTEKLGYAPISWPAPESKSGNIRTANSLWQDGSRTFFRDQRARNIGDILMVNVTINDKAEIDNKTERKRQTTDDLDIPGLFGMQDKIFDALPGDVSSTTDILSIAGSTDTSGEGTIEREEVIETKVAAVVTQVLPNGNMFINGTQEIRVNFEVRQLTVAGIIRPEDIASDNSVELSQIAEARVSYGGRGLITDMQQPRIGSQLVDILSPF